MNQKVSGVLLIIVALLVGGVLGGAIVASRTPFPQATGGGLRVGIGGGPPSVSPSSSTAPTLRLQLNRLLIEHGVLTSQYLKDFYDNKDTSADMTALDANSSSIDNLMGSVFGSNAQSDFSNLWQQHIDLYKNYTLALKSNNSTAQNQAKSQLQTLSSRMGDFFNTQSSSIPAGPISTQMTDHVDLTLSIIDNYASKDMTGVVTQETAASNQAGQMADSLTQYIVSAKPNLFK